MVYYILWLMLQIIKRFLFNKIEGLENIPKKKMPLIVVANHINDLDPFRIGAFAHLNNPFHWFAKKELFSVKETYNDYIKKIKIPFITRLFSLIVVYVTKRCRTIPVDRNNDGSRINRLAILKAKELLTKNSAIGIFGEGGIGRQGQARPVFVSLAKKTGALILPVKVEKNRIVFGSLVNVDNTVSDSQKQAQEIMDQIYKM
ncbi:1-acyl-sn-glycerol-3-phosphate acyltransferase [Candidatus Magnetoovum chiemensis]|nr:1-acyl-sn-glycerol-3-phosphate acyltransferase [Candidatus Magnetoovum chiemensis]